MNRVRLIYRMHQPDLILAWGGAIVIVLFVSPLIEAFH